MLRLILHVRAINLSNPLSGSGGARTLPVRWPYLWLTALILLAVASACRTPDTGESDYPLSLHNPSADMLSGAMRSRSTSLPPPEHMQNILPTVVPPPTPAPTPFPDEQQIVAAVLGRGSAEHEHWVTHIVSGSFTTPGSDEKVALVGNIGDDDQVRWVVVGQMDEGGVLLGTSEWRGAGFDAPPSFYLPPDLLDFDNDGRQELLSHYSRTQRGWIMAADTLYRWDRHALARIWSVDTIVDNTTADVQELPHPYRENYRAEWEWEDLDDDDVDEILLREHVTFHPANNADVVLGKGNWKRAFRWDGGAFRPYAPAGPAGIFCYTSLGDLWLWQEHTARPLDVEYGVENVQELNWAPDGQRLAWWGDRLGIYDLETDTRREFSVDDTLTALHWTPEGRLAYTLSDRSTALLDPETGNQEMLPAVMPGAWSADGKRVTYERDGGLHVYDLSTHEERTLILEPAEAERTPAALPHPVWSPRGDWIACPLGNTNTSWVGLISPDLSVPLSGFYVQETFGDRQSSDLQFAWSPTGFHLATLAPDTNSPSQPTVLYLAEAPVDGDSPVGRAAWREMLRLDAQVQEIKLTWSPQGDRLVVGAGNEVWEVTTLGEATQRYTFSIPGPRWTALEYAPDGSGFLVGLEWIYDEHLYWFPADDAEPTLLLAGSLETVRWAPRSGDSRPTAMVFIEYTDDAPLFHFVDRDGTDTVVAAKGVEPDASFQVGNQRVYYDRCYTDRNGGVSLSVLGGLHSCREPLLSPNGQQLAWVCDEGPPDWSAMMEGTAEISFRVFLTDGKGRDPREVWSHVETGPDYRGIQPLSWRADGEVIYLSQPEYGVAWAYFDYNPGILALDVNTGQVTPIGDVNNIHDGRVSPDGSWLVQSRIPEWPQVNASITLRSLIDGAERPIDCAAGAMAAGDFSFSPGNTWLTWREWVTEASGPKVLIRALRLPDGEPFTVHRDTEQAAPRIGGWLMKDDLVLIYPVQKGGNGGQSTVITLPNTGPGELLSPYTFLGVLDGDS